jgi:hypothetical protein
MTPPFHQITAHDLVEFRHTIPPPMLYLMKCIGDGPALALFNAFMGVELTVPGADKRRTRAAKLWDELEAVIGAEATDKLAKEYGTERLQIPVFRALRGEKRLKYIRTAFDTRTASTGPAMTARAAIRSICMDLNRVGWPMTFHQIEMILNH